METTNETSIPATPTMPRTNGLTEEQRKAILAAAGRRKDDPEYLQFTFLSSIAAEELLTGYMSIINRSRNLRSSLSLPQAHEGIAKALEDIRLFPLMIYLDAAEAIYRTFPPALIRIGAQNCRIAGQA